jgi:hypothetical protein
MPQAIFCPDKGATLEKVPAGSGLKMVDLTPAVGLHNPAFVHFGQDLLKTKLRI